VSIDFNFGLSDSFAFDMIEYERQLIHSTKSIEDPQSFYKQVVLNQEKINKPMLHPALRDRDPAVQRDHFSTAATMSDCSDQMDGNKSIVANDIQNINSKRQKHHENDRPFDILSCSNVHSNDMEGDWNELDNMSSASQHHERREHATNSESLPHKRRLFPVATADKKAVTAYHSSSNSANASTYPYAGSVLSGLDDLDRNSNAFIYESTSRQAETQRRSLRFHDEEYPMMNPSSYWKAYVPTDPSSLAYGFHNNDNNMSDDASVATSLLVEVASIDEDGLYVSYGGQSDDDDLPEHDSLRLGGSSPDLSANNTVVDRYAHSPALHPSVSAVGSFQFGSDDVTASRIRSATSSVSSYSIRDEVQNAGPPSSVDEWSLHGYDGGSERAKRDEESDYEGDDLGTVGEDIELNDDGSVAVLPDEVSYSMQQRQIKKRRKAPTMSMSNSSSSHVGVRYPSENCYPSFGEYPLASGGGPISSSPGLASNSKIFASPVLSQASTSQTNPSPRVKQYHQRQYYQSRKRERRKASLNL
jgi:hypothetical protein